MENFAYILLSIDVSGGFKKKNLNFSVLTFPGVGKEEVRPRGGPFISESFAKRID